MVVCSILISPLVPFLFIGILMAYLDPSSPRTSYAALNNEIPFYLFSLQT